jgi:hypothetical protein
MKRGLSSGVSSSAASNTFRICCHLSGFNVMPRADFSEEPRARRSPISLHRRGRDAQDICRVINGKAAEETQLDDFALLSIQLLQLLQGFFKIQKIDALRLGLRDSLIELQFRMPAPRFAAL